MRINSRLAGHILLILLLLALALLAPRQANSKLESRIAALEVQVQQNSELVQYQYSRWDECRRSQLAIVELLEERGW